MSFQYLDSQNSVSFYLLGEDFTVTQNIVELDFYHFFLAVSAVYQVLYFLIDLFYSRLKAVDHLGVFFSQYLSVLLQRLLVLFLHPLHPVW
jgi:hypothetical protein